MQEKVKQRHESEQEAFYDSDSHETSSDKVRAPESRELDSAEPDEDEMERKSTKI